MPVEDEVPKLLAAIAEAEHWLHVAKRDASEAMGALEMHSIRQAEERADIARVHVHKARRAMAKIAP